MIAALGIGFYYCWEMTLLLILIVPLMAGAALMELRSKVRDSMKLDKELQDNSDEDHLSKSTSQQKSDAYRFIASETLTNIRTVTMLNSGTNILKSFKSALDDNHSNDMKNAVVRGAAYAFSVSMLFFAYAASFRFGIYLIEVGRVTNFTDIYRVMMAMVFGAMAIGQNSSQSPDYAEAKTSANRVFSVFRKKPKIDARTEEGKKLIKSTDIDSKNVVFRYPSRPEIKVLNDICFSIKSGESIALVGQSGCGKSTIFQLLQRFYDYETGKLSLDNTEIKSNNIKTMRHHFGLVQQEPILFGRSIADNIRYGLADSMKIPIDYKERLAYEEKASFEELVPIDKVIKAAKSANAHDFIMDLPEKYDTTLNESALSGGQKQRVAIARALIREPEVLLLDEATSALDTESEALVMEALDKASQKCTSIVIAHRLKTVREADRIFIVDQGRVVEQGSHVELIERRGVYFNLVQAQM